MKCLSGRQPWWWAILHAGKRIENRVWNTSYRGPILLHAAKGCTRDEFHDAVEWMVGAGVVDTVWTVPPLKRMDLGGIVGRARIVDVIEPRPYDRERCWPGVDLRWHMPDQYGFVLDEVEPLPFAPMKGMLGLFEAPTPGERAMGEGAHLSLGSNR